MSATSHTNGDAFASGAHCEAAKGTASAAMDRTTARRGILGLEKCHVGM
jgi:hypothetical protein